MNLTPENLRKAAVLIASVDHSTADALLEQMPDEQARLIRQAVMDLPDESLDDADRVLAEFLAAGGRHDDRCLPSISIAIEPPLRQPRNWSDVDLPKLARSLAGERPRLTAIVMTQLTPEQGARLMRLLPDAMQADVLRAIATNDGPPDETLLAEIESQLFDSVTTAPLEPDEPLAGFATIEAILQAADEGQRAELLRRLETVDASLANRLSTAVSRPTPAAAAPPDSTPSNSRFGESRTSDDSGSEFSSRQATFADLEFDDLKRLDDRSLARVFREADWPTLMLALMDAEPELIERLARQLSPKAAGLLRRRIENPGLLCLRDIELAQQEITRLIAELAARGLVRLPHHRAFTVAV
ncbi:MAG: FliG C-terminal domain-containing protein [Pirellulaceae bacterium]